MARKPASSHLTPKPAAQAKAEVSDQSTAPASGPAAPAESAAAPAKAPRGKGKAEGPALIVRGPKGGRRRAGFAFGPEPVTLTREELPQTVAGVDAMLAILADPKLSCRLINAEGEECLVTDDVIADLEAERDAIIGQLVGEQPGA